MDSSYSQLVSFIWGIADDVLRDVFLRGQYRDVILPMVVLRRLDALLEPTKEKVEEELADVLNYCILLADAYDLDLDEIVQKKVKQNAEKYPVSKAYGSSAKYTEYEKDERKC